MSLFYIFGGIKHFTNVGWYMKIMPPYIPYHKELVYLSGAFEIILGIMLLFEQTRFLSGWGLILLLIAVFPANIYLAQTNGAAMNISPDISLGEATIPSCIYCFSILALKSITPNGIFHP